MIDLATLTGAVSVALADRYAAMFTLVMILESL